MENRKQDVRKNEIGKEESVNRELYIPLRYLLGGTIEIPSFKGTDGDPASFIFGMQWLAAYAACGFGVFFDEPDDVIAARTEMEKTTPTFDDVNEMMCHLNQTFDYVSVDEDRAKLYLSVSLADDDEECGCCDGCCDDCSCEEDSMDDIIDFIHKAADGHEEYMETTGQTVEDALAEAAYVIDTLREELNNSRDEVGMLEKQVGHLENLIAIRKKNGLGGKGA